MLFDNISVTKASGDKVPFSVVKLRNSLEKAGAGEEMIEDILKELQKTIIHQEVVTSRALRHKAFQLLRKKSRPIAARYNLRRSIMQLGPSGYPFERYIGEILKFQGYEVQVGVVVEGNCLSHEVDVLAENGTKKIMVECKYYNSTNKKSDTQTALYVHSRFNDIAKQWKKSDASAQKEYQCWIANNTTFSKDAMKYGRCNNMILISWDYPNNGNLKQRIELSGLYPLTCLTALTNAEKKSLLDQGYILVRNILDHPELLDPLRLSKTKRKRVLEEIEALVI